MQRILSLDVCAVRACARYLNLLNFSRECFVREPRSVSAEKPREETADAVEESAAVFGFHFCRRWRRLWLCGRCHCLRGWRRRCRGGCSLSHRRFTRRWPGRFRGRGIRRCFRVIGDWHIDLNLWCSRGHHWLRRRCWRWLQAFAHGQRKCRVSGSGGRPAEGYGRRRFRGFCIEVHRFRHRQ